MPREPGDALDVEVVGRLVEEQDVPLPGEQPGERDPAPLPAAEVPTGDSQGTSVAAADHVTDPGVARPLVLVAVADDRR